MRFFEVGVTDIQHPHNPRWTGHIVQAEDAADAEDLFERSGYYRNFVVRDIKYPLHFKKT